MASECSRFEVFMTDQLTKVPTIHGGRHYQQFLSELTKKRGVKRYLEIGVQQGRLMSMITAETAVGVDPRFVLSSNVTTDKKVVSLVQSTSDEFFAGDPKALLRGSPDFAFLDGFHTFEYLLRDFSNTEAISDKNTLIALHDCLPLTEAMTMRSHADAVERGKDTSFRDAWTGDVWKIVPILRAYRPDLKLVFVDAPPTGLVFVTNLDPSSMVLSDRYLEIVSRFSLQSDPIEQMYESIEFTPTDRVLNQLDNTLLFRT
jgi:hypothetical protein